MGGCEGVYACRSLYLNETCREWQLRDFGLVANNPALGIKIACKISGEQFCILMYCIFFFNFPMIVLFSRNVPLDIGHAYVRDIWDWNGKWEVLVKSN